MKKATVTGAPSLEKQGHARGKTLSSGSKRVLNASRTDFYAAIMRAHDNGGTASNPVPNTFETPSEVDPSASPTPSASTTTTSTLLKVPRFSKGKKKGEVCSML